MKYLQTFESYVVGSATNLSYGDQALTNTDVSGGMLPDRIRARRTKPTPRRSQGRRPKAHPYVPAKKTYSLQDLKPLLPDHSPGTGG